LKRKDVLNAVIALSVVIFILDILIYYDVLTDNALPFAFTVEEMSILISLLPLALIVIMCLLYKGRGKQRLLWVAVDVITLTLAWEFLADPCGVSALEHSWVSL